MKIFAVIIVVITIAIGVGVYNLKTTFIDPYPDFTYRYRMTVEVDTPEGVKSGSSVIEVKTIQRHEGLKQLFGKAASSTFKGEAPIVHLSDNRYLIALLHSDSNWNYAKGIIPYTFPMSGRKGSFNYYSPVNKSIEYYKNLGNNLKGNIPSDQLPILVVLNNINNSEVQIIEPNELASIFGEGVSLRRILLEITNDPVTWILNNKLNWLSEGKMKTALKYKNGNKKELTLYSSQFSTFGKEHR